jgi:hypothetical protein
MKLVLACLCTVALVSIGCANGGGLPTNPSATAGVSGLAAAPRSGALHVTKECSGYTGGPGSFCMITASNVKAIEVDSKILYLQPDQLFNNAAQGNCSLAAGVCTFSGGTGKFTTFQARVDVTANDDFSLWFWNGTYSFSPLD